MPKEKSPLSDPSHAPDVKKLEALGVDDDALEKLHGMGVSPGVLIGVFKKWLPLLLELLSGVGGTAGGNAPQPGAAAKK